MRYLYKNILSGNTLHAVSKEAYSRNNDHTEYHPHYEICILPENRKYVLTVGGKTSNVTGPCAVYLSPFSVHHISLTNNDTSFVRMIYYFSEEALKLLQSILPSDIPQNNENVALFPTSRCISDSELLFKQSISGYATPKEGLCILALTINKIISSTPVNNRIVYNADESRLSEILRYISAHLEEKLTTEILANEFHMSRSTLDRLFRMYAEQTVKDTITECRISTAKDLLSATDAPIKEIMVKCGFQSENHFFAFFKSHTGITPNKYRQANYTDKFNLKQC